MKIVFLVLAFVFGAAMGSFLCCQARRLHLMDTKHKKLGNRSVCLHCGKKLKWYHNIPIVSWCLQKGKCVYCHKKIGFPEILSELGSAIAITAVSFNFNFPATGVQDYILYIVTILFTLSLIFLAIYDGMYGELPTFALIISLILGLITMLVNLSPDFSGPHILDALGGVAILGGVYLLLYLFSRGKWVGNGDYILGTAIAAALSSTWFSLLILFISNLSATIIMYPFVIKNKNHKIYFGPFLVLAYVIIKLCENILVIP